MSGDVRRRTAAATFGALDLRPEQGLELCRKGVAEGLLSARGPKRIHDMDEAALRWPAVAPTLRIEAVDELHLDFAVAVWMGDEVVHPCVHPPLEQGDPDPGRRLVLSLLLLLCSLHGHGALPGSEHRVHASEDKMLDAVVPALHKQFLWVPGDLRRPEVDARGDVAADPVSTSHVYREDRLPAVGVLEPVGQPPGLDHLKAVTYLALNLLLLRLQGWRCIDGRGVGRSVTRRLDIPEGHRELVAVFCILFFVLPTGGQASDPLLPLRRRIKGSLVGALATGRGASSAHDRKHRGISDALRLHTHCDRYGRDRQWQCLWFVLVLAATPGACLRSSNGMLSRLPPRGPLGADIGLQGLCVGGHRRCGCHASVDDVAGNRIPLAMALPELVPLRRAKEGQHHLLVFGL
mmetsp:Transcript_8539/g.19652  ORF Transcript_8539/g.19652 Transcript_8539/m.19652 type:complete len:406 (+) Transcript_8539:159-1376(+)